MVRFILEALYNVTPLTAGYIVVLESVGWGSAAILFSGTDLKSEKWLIRAGAGLVAISLAGFALSFSNGELWTRHSYPLPGRFWN